MNDLQKRLEQVVSSSQRRLIQNKEILPIKTHEGILVGSVKIISRETVKDLWQFDTLVYEGIYLNKVAIKLANILAIHRKCTINADRLYAADQDYGRLLLESIILRERLHRARQASDHDKADLYLARYTVAKDRATYAKRQVLALAGA